MLSLFQRKRVPPAAAAAPPTAAETPKGLLRPAPAAVLLATPRRQQLLDHIWQRTSLSLRQFASLYLAPLERYAELVQQLPASQAHHHAYPGGMLDHGLETVACALKLRQSHLLPAGATPEDQAAQAEAWTAATAYAALLHDVGKIAVDLHVEYLDGTVWHPWHGPLLRPYRLRYRKDRSYRLHGAATGLLYTGLLDGAIFDWLSGYPELWAALLYVLAGQYEHAGTLGELVVQADRASVAQALGGDPGKALSAPRQALQRKLLDGLRHLLDGQFKLNQPQASDGWLTADALWLVSKSACDKLRAHLLAQGMDGIPASNTAVFNVLQDHGIVQPTPDGKAVWKATVTSDTGWSHSLTFLKLSPAMIWEAAQRPAPFAGRVEVDMDVGQGEEQGGLESQTPAATAAMCAQQKAASASAMPVAPVTADSGVTALLNLPDAPPTPSTPATAPEPVAQAGLLPPPAIAAQSRPPLPAAAMQTESVPPSATKAQSGPVSPPTAAAQPNPAQPPALDPTGEHFMTWLRQHIQTHKLIINDARALVHTVSGTAFLVSPGVFQRYAQEYLHVAAQAKQENLQGWQWLQKRFEKLGLHRKQPNGLNIWTLEVTGPRKSRRLHGYLLNNPGALFHEVPPDNPYLCLPGKSAKHEDTGDAAPSAATSAD